MNVFLEPSRRGGYQSLQSGGLHSDRKQGEKLLPYKYKKIYSVKHNSVILLRCSSYIVSFNDMFRL